MCAIPIGSSISGLMYIPGYLDCEPQLDLLAFVDRQPWLDDLQRRVQHHGWRYDYRARSMEGYLGPLPPEFAAHTQRFVSEGWISELPEQVIVNEYLPGQGISRHVDCEPCFGETILTVSLGSTCIMIFSEKSTGIRLDMLLEPGSLLVMTGQARHDWRHEIPRRARDVVNGHVLARGRRVSLTFRTIRHR